MTKDETNELIDRLTDIISYSKLNNLFYEVVNKNFTPALVNFDVLSNETLWEGIDPKFKYLALELESDLVDDIYTLYYFEEEPAYVYGIWDTDGHFISDRFQQYTSTLKPEQTLMKRS
jgi:hypothetical protein